MESVRLAQGLSETQRMIFFKKKELGSYEAVLEQVSWYDPERREMARLSGPGPLSKCLRKTALGIRYVPGQSGGPTPLLCEEDIDLLMRVIERRADELNCITTIEAKILARKVLQKRFEQARNLLYWVGSPKLAQEIGRHTKDFTSDWLCHNCTPIGMSIMKPEAIEQARRDCCNRREIESWFDNYAQFFNRDRSLILNADETQVVSRKMFKVVVPAGRRPIAPVKSALPHFTAMCCVSSAGHPFKPVLILPNLKFAPDDVSSLASETYFISTDTGWMTQKAFLLWCHIMAYELSLYRRTLDPTIRNDSILLTVDGHSSRASYEAASFLKSQGIELLIFPAHSTHVLQPFDVTIASPLKCHLERLNREICLKLDKFLTSLLEQPIDENTVTNFTQHARNQLVMSFLDAWRMAATLGNIQSGFTSCGLVHPCQRARPLNSPLLPKNQPPELFSRSRTSPISGKLLTSDIELQALHDKTFNLFGNEEGKVSDGDRQWMLLTATLAASNNGDGHLLLTDPALLFWKSLSPSLRNQGHQICPSWFTKRIFSLSFQKIDYEHVGFLCRNIHEAKIVFVCIDSKFASGLSSSFTEAGQIHCLMIGVQSREERLANWNSFRDTDGAILIASRIVLSGLDPGRQCLSVLCQISGTRNLLLDVVHAWGPVVLVCRNVKERNLVQEIPRTVTPLANGESVDM